MPAAFIDTSGDDRVPRTLFAHAHQSGRNEYPALIGGGNQSEAFTVIPDNWNGLSLIRLWWLSGFTETLNDVSVVIHIATCGEAYNTHTQTVNAMTVALTLNQYTCQNLTVTHATVLANLQAGDLIRVLASTSSENNQYLMGLEIQET